eukprot:TRINITY_DN1355_c0_g1_i1.p1 TRINITY_DN1355_c0_g1~~TRINITY_DN1355_c0_g1_i1.p1  ORF type:complete len:155 (-),score=42.39 TRINITY_DN1355_c0_g1_i1:155-619(-)
MKTNKGWRTHHTQKQQSTVKGAPQQSPAKGSQTPRTQQEIEELLAKDAALQEDWKRAVERVLASRMEKLKAQLNALGLEEDLSDFEDELFEELMENPFLDDNEVFESLITYLTQGEDGEIDLETLLEILGEIDEDWDVEIISADDLAREDKEEL